MSNYNEELLKKAGGSASLNDAIRRGDVNGALASLDAETAAKIKSVIADREAAERLLKSPQAQQLMKMFLKGKD